MTTTLKVRKIGNSSGIILSRDILERLRVEDGDSLLAIETPRGIELSVYDPTVARQMEVAERVMREDREVLRKLAE